MKKKELFLSLAVSLSLSSCWWKRGQINDILEIGQTLEIFGDPDGKERIGTFSPELHDDSFCLHFEMEKEIEFTFLMEQVGRIDYNVVFPGSSQPDKFFGAYLHPGLLAESGKGCTLPDPDGASHELFFEVFHNGARLDLKNPRVFFAKGTNELQIPLLDEGMSFHSFESADIDYYSPEPPYSFLGDVLYLDPERVENSPSRGLFLVEDVPVRTNSTSHNIMGYSFRLAVSSNMFCKEKEER